jgi:dihydrofolate reductase
MATVTTNMTMSLDGFIAHPDDTVGELFDWYAAGPVTVATANDDVTVHLDEASAEVFADAVASVGALVTGRTLFDLTNGWGGTHPAGCPVFVVTHTAPADWPHPDAPFTFVTDGVASAIAQAKAVAGDGTVAIASAKITQQALDLGLVDKITVDLAPVLLGDGVPFFANLATAPIRLGDPTVVQGSRVTHLSYDVLPA